MPGGGQPYPNNPFSRLFSPSSSSPVFSTIGRFMGNPTDEQVMSQQMGSQQQAGFAVIAERIRQGASPQKAMVDFITTPEGVDFFAGGGDLNTMLDFVETLQPAAPPEDYTLSANQQRYSGATNELLASAPSEAVATFQGMAELAALSEDERRIVAGAQLDSMTTGDLTETERNTKALVEKGIISETTAEMINGGILKFVTDPWTQTTTIQNLAAGQPGTNLPGQGMDPTMMDQGGEGAITTAPEGFGLGAQPQPAQPSPTLTPEQVEEAPDGTLLPPGNPASIIRGAGWMSAVTGGLGNVAGDVHPSLAAPETNAQRAALEKIKLAVSGLRAGNRLAMDAKLVSDIVDFGATTPVNYGTKLIQLHDFLDKEESQRLGIVNSASASKQAKLRAEEDLETINRARLNLPDRESLKAEVAAISSEGGAAAQVTGVTTRLSKAVKAVSDAVKGGAKEGAAPEAEKAAAPQSYPDEATVIEAARRGEVKAGQTVIINGVERTLEYGE